jgi:cold shock CspA family protein
MQVPVQVSFQNMPLSDDIEAAVWKHAEALERYCTRITSCRVVIDSPHRHHRKGQLYSVRIDLTVPPGGEIVVNREHRLDHAHEDVNVALRNAFHAARRQLEDHVRRFRGDVKEHEETGTGRVARLFPDEGYGFIETPDGREVYFHRNAFIQDAFDDLRIGDLLSFLEEPGEQGPNATSIRIIQHRRQAPLSAGPRPATS